jgi:hypothetical protein
MSLTITRSRVKEKCGISDTSYDTTIDNLILELTPVIEYEIDDEALADSNTGVQATLNLAATEITCGELLAQRFRELGTLDSVSLGEIKIDPGETEQGFELIVRGYERLKPFLKSDSYGNSSRVSTAGGLGSGGGEA